MAQAYHYLVCAPTIYRTGVRPHASASRIGHTGKNMAYDEKLAARIRRVLPLANEIREQKMFGGICFMWDGKMACGVIGRDLMVRVGAERYPALARRPHARPMDFTGKPLTGFLYVAPAGCATAATLRTWVQASLAYVATLPPPKPRKPRPRVTSLSRRT